MRFEYLEKSTKTAFFGASVKFFSPNINSSAVLRTRSFEPLMPTSMVVSSLRARELLLATALQFLAKAA
jgi:hypothetical protein